ncbi:MAG: DUF2802 domain-containing protein [Gammaproteobacteria bacterium]|nr:DUF2802 domain-containing protein [Gammaproteobacteria bacterium]
MSLDVTVQIAVAAVAAVALLALLSLAVSMVRLRRDHRALRAECAALQGELGALCAGASGMGTHLSRLDQQVMRLGERQDDLESHDTLHREYDRAVKLVREGAGVEEIMSQCNLIRTEADLLMRLHGGAPEHGQAAA